MFGEHGLTQQFLLRDGQPEPNSTVSFSQMLMDEHLRKVVATVFAHNFPNGIRPNSIIDTNRLKLCCLALDCRISLELSDIPLILESLGVRHGDKVYMVSAESKKKIFDLMQQLIRKGNQLFFYSELYDIHANLLLDMNIFSVKLLKSVLQEIQPNLCFKSKYCLLNNFVSIENEVLRCFSESHCLSHEQLKSMLPYVPIDTIRQMLSKIGEFINIGRGLYTHINNIALYEDECLVAREKLKAEITNSAYVSLVSADLQHSFAMNPHFSAGVVRYAFFQRYLANEHERRGSIVTARGVPINHKVAIREFIKSHKRLTLESLVTFEKDLTGGFHSVSLFIAHDYMVRTNADTFVNDSEISFDVVATDEMLKLFFDSDVIPLQAVTSFTSFPHIDGYSWNWFLLESFCRRFSNEFSYQCLSVNNKNVGALYRKGQAFSDYIDILAYAVVKANVNLTENDIGDFLFEKRYIAVRSNSLKKVLEKSQFLSERGVM